MDHQILWILCSVDFLTFTLKLTIQTLLSVVHEFQVLHVQVKTVKYLAKRAHPCSTTVKNLVKDIKEAFCVAAMNYYFIREIKFHKMDSYKLIHVNFEWKISVLEDTYIRLIN